MKDARFFVLKSTYFANLKADQVNNFFIVI
jgi:hypothetical protein